MDFYDRFVKLCTEKGVKPSPMLESIGIQKTAATNWKTRKTRPTAYNLQKIANYFGVTVEYLKGEAEPKESPAANSDEALMFALYGGDTEDITPEMLNDVRKFAQFIREKKKDDAK